MLLRDADGGAADSLLWKWLKGAATSTLDLGDPGGGDEYTFCLYDASASLLLAARLPAGSLWRQTGSGFRYKEKGGQPDGLRTSILKAGQEGKAQIKMKGRGARLELPSLPLSPPVVAQLKGAGGCWGAVYSAPKRNDSSRFDAKSD